MLPIILIALLALTIVAKFCPDAPLSRSILKALVEGPAQWLARPRLSHAIPCAIAVTVLALVVVAAPELTMIAAGLDVQLLVDLTLALSVAAAQVGLKRARVLAHKTIRVATAPFRANPRSARIRRARPPRTDTSDSDPALQIPAMALMSAA
ncbi:hypothetical protein [Asticcacaulis solisilvae]|uniref:hypothetical protein n=1 Tax=Asticcacaulis solisilvae TaxID=1217274 RepID=UPI003FD800CD